MQPKNLYLKVTNNPYEGIYSIDKKGRVTFWAKVVEDIDYSQSTAFDDNLVRRLTDLVMSDRLTGLANRQKTENYLQYRLNEFKSFQSKFCLIFIDIDNFGRFNDTYGHVTGDEVLTNVARLIQTNIGETGLFGRWGGEEFVGIIQIKNDNEAAIMAEKIRQLVAQTIIAHKNGGLSVTASVGVTVARQNDTLKSIVKRADGLMYRSKQRGKDCITLDK